MKRRNRVEKREMLSCTMAAIAQWQRQRQLNNVDDGGHVFSRFLFVYFMLETDFSGISRMNFVRTD